MDEIQVPGRVEELARLGSAGWSDEDFEVFGHRFFGKIKEVDPQAWSALRSVNEDHAFYVSDHPLRPSYPVGSSGPPVIDVHRMTIFVRGAELWDELRTLAPLLSVAADTCAIHEVVVVDMDDDAALKLVRHEFDPETNYARQPTREMLIDAVARLKEKKDPNALIRESASGFSMNEMEQLVFGALSELDLVFTPQCRVMYRGRIKCRVDFMIYYGGRAVALELDGQQWHSSTEARNRDAERTNFLLTKGITTIRFTGSQIYSDLQRCMFQLIDCLTGARGFTIGDSSDR